MAVTGVVDVDASAVTAAGDLDALFAAEASGSMGGGTSFGLSLVGLGLGKDWSSGLSGKSKALPGGWTCSEATLAAVTAV